MPAPRNYAKNPGMPRFFKVYVRPEGECQKCDGWDILMPAHDAKDAKDKVMALDRMKGCVITEVVENK